MTEGKRLHRAVVVKDGWVACPICRKKKRLLHVLEDTEARNLPVYCRSCKNRLILDIEKGQVVECRVTEALAMLVNGSEA